jgi:hypothetical protein
MKRLSSSELLLAVNEFAEELFRYGSDQKVVQDETVIVALKRLWSDPNENHFFLVHGEIYATPEEGVERADLSQLGERIAKIRMAL